MEHRSNTQSFSGTDLATNHIHNTGIVFPLASADMLPNFAGIMEHRNGNQLARSEYRIANGTIDTETDTPIEYYRGRCITCVAGEPPTPLSDTERMFGITQEDTSYTLTDAIDIPESIQPLLDAWEANPLVPMDDFISPGNVTKKIPTAPKLPSKLVKKMPAANPVDTMFSDIKWFTSGELTRMPYAKLFKEVSELGSFYAVAEDEVYPHLPEGTSTIDLIEEYEFLREMLEEPCTEVNTVEDDELQYMYAQLVSLGAWPTSLQGLSKEELTALYLKEFPYGQYL